MKKQPTIHQMTRATVSRNKRKRKQLWVRATTQCLLAQVQPLATIPYDVERWFEQSRTVDYCTAAALEAVQGLLPQELQADIAHLLAIRDYVWYLPSASAACEELDRLDLPTDTESDSQNSQEGETP